MKISIITINFNNKLGLSKTVNSVKSQTFRDFEHIVIDGNSSDGSKNVISDNKDAFSYSVSEPDYGIYNAMNKGILKAKADYILFLNSGDTLFNDDSLENISMYLGAADILTGHLNMDDDGKTHIVKSKEKITFKNLFKNSIDHPSTFIRRNMFDKVGLYDETLKIVSDWKWFLIALTNYGLTYKSIDCVVSTFTMDGISSKPENRETMINERKKVLADNFPFFIEDYSNLIVFEEDSKNFEKIKKSRLVKLGRKIGLLKNIKF